MLLNIQTLFKKLLRLLFLSMLIMAFSCIGNIAYCASLPVIPGAAGWGMSTPAGRGGAIYRVTNRNASGPGSLKAAIEASGPRVVVFEVSGTITLTKDLHVYNPYITIAGQTAPSPGINIRGAGLFINTHDVLVQHLRIRLGDNSIGPNFENRDGISIDAYAQPVYNVVIDHCSVSWAVDGNLDLWNTPLHDVTIRYSIISEGLHDSRHPKGPHSTGLLIGDGAKRITVFANLMAHNHDRSPLMKQDTSTEIINNLIYNWYRYAIRTFATANIIGNHCQAGPDTQTTAKGIDVQYGGENPSLQPDTVYVAHNIGPGRPTDSGDDWLIVNGDQKYRTNSPYGQRSGITAMNADEVYDQVLAKVGARPVDRDSVDIRVINSVKNRTGKIMNSQNIVGGWPNLVENRRTLNLPNSPTGDDDGDGYTNLEEWLHSLAAEMEGNVSPGPSSLNPPNNLRIQQ